MAEELCGFWPMALIKNKFTIAWILQSFVHVMIFLNGLWKPLIERCMHLYSLVKGNESSCYKEVKNITLDSSISNLFYYSAPGIFLKLKRVFGMLS